MTPAALGGLIRLVDAGTITSPVAKGVFEKMLATGRAADEIVEADGLARIDDESAHRGGGAGGRRRPTPTRSRSIAPASSRRSASWSAR